MEQKKTYDVHVPKTERREHGTWVSQPGSGLDKRQCTLQICISPEGKVRLAVIFRGKGKRISPDEKESYHKDVDIYWQPNAWADTEFSIEWVRKTLKPAVKTDNDEEFIFCDNLTAQTSESGQVDKWISLVWCTWCYGYMATCRLWHRSDA